MQRHTLGVLLTAAALFAACGSPGDSPESLLRAEAAALESQDYALAHSLLAPEYQEDCSIADLAEDWGFGLAFLGLVGQEVDIELRDLAVTVSGERAEATYAYAINGTILQVIDASEPDLLIQIDGVWYDARDSQYDFGC